MNCQEFKQWLNRQDSMDNTASRHAADHIQICQNCEKLYQTDMALDAKLKNAMQSVEPPPGLFARVRDNIESEAGTQPSGFFKVSWKAIIPALSMAALILVILLNPFSGPLQTLDEVVARSIENHLDTDMEMAFKTADVTDIGQWFTRQLAYEVRLPNLKRLGLNPLGGLKCAFGKTDVALLFCNSNGKRVSLFVINQDDIDFHLGENRKYAVEAGELKVNIWQESGMVFAMVI